MNECSVALAGDWHGNHDWALRSIDHLASLGVETIYHLGDFGLWGGSQGYRYYTDISKRLDTHLMKMLVTPGNHENYDLLNEIEPSATDDLHGPVQWLTDRIGFLPRGARWEINGWQFCSLGGAPSVDFERRTEGRDWWPAEAITDTDVATTIVGGPCDVFLTHDAADPPYVSGAVARLLANNPQGWSPKALAYAAEGSQRITKALLALKPVIHAHGHMHLFDDATIELPSAEESTRILSLDCDGMPKGDLALLTLPPKAYGERIGVHWPTLPKTPKQIAWQ